MIILRFRRVGVSLAIPLFYSNRMITPCLETRGMIFSCDPIIRMQLYHYMLLKKNESLRSLRWFQMLSMEYDGLNSPSKITEAQIAECVYAIDKTM